MIEAISSRIQFDSWFQNVFEQRWGPSLLGDVMGYALFPGGKRLRALLSIAICEDLGGDYEHAMWGAAAIECLHIASLIHDDLPCLDNDALRRGRPTCHVQFSESAALLAGDALISWAFELGLASPTRPDAICRILSSAFSALCRGQYLEVAQDKVGEVGFSRTELSDEVPKLKTGALFAGSLQVGAIASGINEGTLLGMLGTLGVEFGVLFQAKDDREDGDGLLMSEIFHPVTRNELEDLFTSAHDISGVNFQNAYRVMMKALEAN